MNLAHLNIIMSENMLLYVAYLEDVICRKNEVVKNIYIIKYMHGPVFGRRPSPPCSRMKQNTSLNMHTLNLQIYKQPVYVILSI